MSGTMGRTCPRCGREVHETRASDGSMVWYCIDCFMRIVISSQATRLRDRLPDSVRDGHSRGDAP